MADVENKRRGPIYAEYRGPGSAAYKLRPLVGTNEHCLTKKLGPSYSIDLKRKELGDQTPGAYGYDPNLTSKGKQEPPRYSLSGRPRHKDLDVCPGPGTYDPQKTKPGQLSNEKKAPAVIIGQRTKWPFKNEAPPPNSYNKPTTVGTGSASVRGAPAWSFSGRTEHGGFAYELISKRNPGPGCYGVTDADVTKRKWAAYSMTARTRQKAYNSALETPGPGAYDPALAKQKKGGFSMGVRHSEYVLPLITQADVV